MRILVKAGARLAVISAVTGIARSVGTLPEILRDINRPVIPT